MRERYEVLEKLNELRAAKLRERRELFLSIRPKNCFFNCRLRVKGNSLVGFCQCPTVLNTLKQKVFVCNDEETARACKCFACRNTEEGVRNEFDFILKSPSRCGREYPKLAMLIWFLQDFDSQNRIDRFRRSLTLFWSSFFRLMTFRWW